MSTDNLVPDLGSVKRIAEAKGLRGELIARALTAFASDTTAAPRAPTPEELEAWTNANPGVRVPGSKVLANGWRQRLEWTGSAWVNAAGAPSVDDAAIGAQLAQTSDALSGLLSAAAGAVPYATRTAFPAASTAPGKTAWATDTGKVYVSQGGGWVELLTLPKQADVSEAKVAASAALTALGNLTRAELSQRAQAAGPQFADGSRWVWSPSGDVNGGTVVAAAGGGVWIRERPRYDAAEFGSLQAALNGAPYGQLVDAGAGGTVAPIVADATRPVVGRGIHAPLILQPGDTQRDLLTIRPPADGNQYAGMALRDLLLIASAGRDAVRVDLTGAGRRMSRLSLDNVHAVAGEGGYALNVVNELGELDAISNSYVHGGSFNGGINLQGVGDSLVIRDAQVSGAHGVHVGLNHKGSGGGGADASQFLISGLNCTGATGIYVTSGTRTRIEYGNLELPSGGAGTGNALIYLQGGPDADSAIEGATIFGNYLAPIQPGKSAIRLGRTYGTQIVNNTITAPANTYAVVIDGNAKNTVIGANRWECTPGFEVQDGGVGTMGIDKPLDLTPYDRTATANRPAPSIIKMPSSGNAGRVTLSGSLSGGSLLASGAVLAVLPTGFRPATYLILPIWVITDAGAATRLIVVNPTGELTWAADVPGATLTEAVLAGNWRAENA